MCIVFFNSVDFAYVCGVKIVISNSSNKIFIAYNTASIAKIAVKKYQKHFDFEQRNSNRDQLTNKNPTSIESAKKIFNKIVEYYKKNKGKFSLYFDILAGTFLPGETDYYITTNKEQIRDSQMFVFVVSIEEISFWQLQEAFFASYYDKKIAYLSTDKFLKLIVNKKFDHYIESKLKSK